MVVEALLVVTQVETAKVVAHGRGDYGDYDDGAGSHRGGGGFYGNGAYISG